MFSSDPIYVVKLVNSGGRCFCLCVYLVAVALAGLLNSGQEYAEHCIEQLLFFLSVMLQCSLIQEGNL